MATPWGRIKASYLAGDKTYQELAKQYHVAEKTIRNRASKEGWRKDKDKVRTETGQKLLARAVRVREDQLQMLVRANEAMANALLQLTEKIAENPMILLGPNADGRPADSISKALRATIDSQRDLYRLPNMDQELDKKKESQRKREAKAKYELEKAKWEAEQAEKAKQTETLSQTVWKIELPEGAAPVDE